MSKLGSLLKASMTEGMQLFRFGKRNKNGKKASPALPIALAVFIGIAIWGYANMMLDSLAEVGAGFVMLTLFVMITSVLTLAEGIYKSGSLLFSCRDDNLMLALPIKKSTVLFVRVFKLYVFETLYNALFLVPAMLAYAIRMDVGWTFYLASILALLLLPVIPIVIACIIGGITTGISTRFKMKNLARIVLTTAVLLLVVFAASNLNQILQNIATNATSINDLITKLYYPAGAYIGMITDFSWLNLLIFVVINVAIFGVMVVVLGKIYYKINSRVKVVRTTVSHSSSMVKIKRKSVMRALITKELRKFIDTPVFVVNAGFGLVLFIVGCILLSINFEAITGLLENYGMDMSFDFAGVVREYAPVILLGLIMMASLMSSITSSMISLEGRSFNILKSLPVKPITIVMGKVLTAVLIMIPFILIGDLIMFLKFDFSLVQILLILAASIILPIVAEMIGIAINLKYPKMNAESDAEVVKQSTSPMVATFLGMGMTAVSVFGIFKAIEVFGGSIDLTLGALVVIYALILLLLLFYLKKVGTKKFNEITA